MSTEFDPLIESNRTYEATEEKSPSPPHPVNFENKKEGEEGQEEVERSSSRNETTAKEQLVFIGLLSVLIVMVAVTCSLSLAQYVVKLDNKSVGMDALIVYMTIGMAVIALMCLKGDVSAPKDRRRPMHGSFRSQLKAILRHSLSIVGMSIFYPFSCVLDLFVIFTATGCGSAFVREGGGRYGSYVAEVYFHLMRILFMGSELVFCYRFHNAWFKKKDSIRCGLMIVMIVNIGLWFITLLSEAVHHAENHSNHTQTPKKHQFSSGRNLTNNLTSNDCLNFNTTQYHFLKTTVTQFLYPFSIEFSLLVGEFLAEKFLHCQTQTSTGQEASAAIIESVENSYEEEPEAGEAFDHKRCRMLAMVILITVGLFVNVVCVTLSLYVSLEKIPILLDDKRQRFQAYLNFYSNLATVLTVLGFFCGGFNNLRARPMRGLDNLIMLSALGPLVNGIINSVAFVQNFQRYSQLKLYLGNEIVHLVQISLQIPFLFYSDRVKFDHTWSGSLRRGLFRGILLYMAMCNITMWIRLSCRGLLSDSLVVSSVPIFNAHSSTYKFIDGIFAPLAIFFRFNSFLLFVRAFLGT